MAERDRTSNGPLVAGTSANGVTAGWASTDSRATTPNTALPSTDGSDDSGWSRPMWTTCGDGAVIPDSSGAEPCNEKAW